MELLGQDNKKKYERKYIKNQPHSRQHQKIKFSSYSTKFQKKKTKYQNKLTFFLLNKRRLDFMKRGWRSNNVGENPRIN